MPSIAERGPGLPGPKVLTQEQEAKLRELWYEMGKLIGLDVDGIAREHGVSDLGTAMEHSIASAAAEKASTPQPKKRRLGGLVSAKSEGAEANNEKHGSSKQFRNAIAEMSHEELRMALWNFSKCDDPDSNLCRYLRARKWVVRDALVMLVSTIHWRNRVKHLDDDVLYHGEEDALKIDQGEMSEVGGLSKKIAHDLIDQLRMGKAFVHGRDLQGRPMCFIRVKLHRIGSHSTDSLERLVLYMIENARFMLDPPNLETVMVVFDMSEFSLMNADYVPLKFIIKVFEANYPESLGAVLVHRAPWIFQSIWGTIKGWLDPVVASKIHFTKDVSDLAEYIDLDSIPTELGGHEDWSYSYLEPIDGENDKMADTKTRAEIEAERQGLLDQYEAATIEWVVANGVNDANLKARRKDIARALYVNYWKLDPYVRARTLLDRLHLIGPKPGTFNSPSTSTDGHTKNGNGSLMNVSTHSTIGVSNALTNGSSSVSESQQSSPPSYSNGSTATAAAAATASAALVGSSAFAPRSDSLQKEAVKGIESGLHSGEPLPLELNVTELCFNRPSNQEIERKLTLRNPNAVALAFKVKTTSPRQCLVRPPSGRLDPGQHTEICIHFQPIPIEPPADAVCGDKFLFQSVAIPSSHLSTPIPDLWTSVDRSTPTQEVKLRVSYLPSTSSINRKPLTPSTANNTAPTSEQLTAQIATAQATIASLNRQVQEGQRQRKTATVASRPSVPAGMALQQAPVGVPVHVVAGACLMSFLIAFLLF